MNGIRVLIYARVAPGEILPNISSTHPLIEQMIKILNYADRYGYKIIDSIRVDEEDYADIEQRPGVTRTIEYCRRENIKYVLVGEATRLGRSLYAYNAILSYFEECGLTIILADGTSTRRPDIWSMVERIRNVESVIARKRKTHAKIH